MPKRDHRGRTGAHSARPAKSSGIEGQFIAHRIEMLESTAWASLNLAARRVLDRLEIEHAHHGGKENGKLPCTYDDFERFGVRRASVAAAIRLLEAAGLLEVTHSGRGGNGEFRDPARYRLTYLKTAKANPTDEWRKVTPPRDIDSRSDNASGPVGAKTRPVSSLKRRENASSVERENASGFAKLSGASDA